MATTWMVDVVDRIGYRICIDVETLCELLRMGLPEGLRLEHERASLSGHLFRARPGV